MSSTIHEYRVVERFCLELDDAELRDALLDAIRGRGAFRRFKDVMRLKGIDTAWHEYRNQALRRLEVTPSIAAQVIVQQSGGRDE